MEENPNRAHLDRLKNEFEEWLHIEDPYLLYTIAATKLSHQLPGDPVWLMIIGPSSGGKSEYLRAFKQDNEHQIDDLTENTFISGYKGTKKEKETPQFAEKLKDHIWYIYDLSILMSKYHDERSKILSQLRMIYDGLLTKVYGNKQQITVDTYKNTLICGSTNAIDDTILEDQQLGTRFMHYRIPKSDRWAMMNKIDFNQDRVDVLREELNSAVRQFEHRIKPTHYELTEVDNNNLQTLSNMCTLLRTSISYDTMGEPKNIAYPEEPGRFYKQLKKVYQSYMMLGLTHEEALIGVKKICVDNINPVRVNVLKTAYLNSKNNGWDDKLTTTQLHTLTGLGKKTVKKEMHALNLLNLADYSVVVDQFGRVTKDLWSVRDANFSLLFNTHPKIYHGRTLYQFYRRYQKDS